MLGRVVFGLLMVVGPALAADPCLPLQPEELERRPLPYPVLDREGQEKFMALVGQNGPAVVRVLVPWQEAGSPQLVQVEVFLDGRQEWKGELWLAGKFPKAREENIGGVKRKLALIGAMVSADGSLVGLQGQDRLLVFRRGEEVAQLEGVWPMEDCVLTEEAAFYAPLVDRGNEPVLLYALALRPGAKREPVLSLPDKAPLPQQLRLVPRWDGKFFAVEIFSGEVQLLDDRGRVRRRWPSPLGAGVSREEENLRQLDRMVAETLKDATRQPPKVEVQAASRSERVFGAAAVGKDLVVGAYERDALEPEKGRRLYYLDTVTGAWSCRALPRQWDLVILRPASDGVFLRREGASHFVPKRAWQNPTPDSASSSQGP